jgi:hypothetical protein
MKPKPLRGNKANADRDDRDYLEEGLTEQEAAAFLGLSVRFLQNRRTRGGGPKFVGISRRCVRYRRRDLIAWSDALSRAHTSETDAPGASQPKSTRRKRIDPSRRGPTTDPETEERP